MIARSHPRLKGPACPEQAATPRPWHGLAKHQALKSWAMDLPDVAPYLGLPIAVLPQLTHPPTSPSLQSPH
jgi:hypothetical protein